MTISTTSFEDEIARARRSATPSPELRLTHTRPALKELFFTPPKELLPSQTRELFPHERVFAPLPTPRKELFPTSSENLPVADSTRLVPSSGKELFTSGWPMQIARGKDPRQSPDNPRESYSERRKEHLPKRAVFGAAVKWEQDQYGFATQSNLATSGPPNNVSQKGVTVKPPQRHGFGSTGKWKHDLFDGTSPYLDQPTAPRRPTDILSTCPTGLLLGERARNVPQKTSESQDTRSTTNSQLTKDLIAINDTSVFLVTSNPKENSLPRSIDHISRHKLRQTSRGSFSTPRLAQYTSSESKIPTQSCSLPNPVPKRELTLDSANPQTSSPTSISSSTTLSSPRRRPETTDLVARRMIGSGLGLRIPKRSDERSIEIEEELRGKRPSSGNETSGTEEIWWGT